jgi:hypothetical protein
MKKTSFQAMLLILVSSPLLARACDEHAKKGSDSSPLASSAKSLDPTDILDIEKRSASVTEVCKTKACTVPAKKSATPVKAPVKAR